MIEERRTKGARFRTDALQPPSREVRRRRLRASLLALMITSAAIVAIEPRANAASSATSPSWEVDVSTYVDVRPTPTGDVLTNPGACGPVDNLDSILKVGSAGDIRWRVNAHGSCSVSVSDSADVTYLSRVEPDVGTRVVEARGPAGEILWSRIAGWSPIWARPVIGRDGNPYFSVQRAHPGFLVGLDRNTGEQILDVPFQATELGAYDGGLVGAANATVRYIGYDGEQIGSYSQPGGGFVISAAGRAVGPDGTAFISGVTACPGPAILSKFTPAGLQWTWRGTDQLPCGLFGSGNGFDVAATPDGGVVVSYWRRDLTPVTAEVVSIGPDGSLRWQELVDAPAGTSGGAQLRVDNKGTVVAAYRRNHPCANNPARICVGTGIQSWTVTTGLQLHPTMTLSGPSNEYALHTFAIVPGHVVLSTNDINSAQADRVVGLSLPLIGADYQLGKLGAPVVSASLLATQTLGASSLPVVVETTPEVDAVEFDVSVTAPSRLVRGPLTKVGELGGRLIWTANVPTGERGVHHVTVRAHAAQAWTPFQPTTPAMFITKSAPPVPQVKLVRVSGNEGNLNERNVVELDASATNDDGGAKNLSFQWFGPTKGDPVDPLGFRAEGVKVTHYSVPEGPQTFILHVRDEDGNLGIARIPVCIACAARHVEVSNQDGTRAPLITGSASDFQTNGDGGTFRLSVRSERAVQWMNLVAETTKRAALSPPPGLVSPSDVWAWLGVLPGGQSADYYVSAGSVGSGVTVMASAGGSAMMWWTLFNTVAAVGGVRFEQVAKADPSRLYRVAKVIMQSTHVAFVSAAAEKGDVWGVARGVSSIIAGDSGVQHALIDLFASMGIATTQGAIKSFVTPLRLFGVAADVYRGLTELVADLYGPGSPATSVTALVQYGSDYKTKG